MLHLRGLGLLDETCLTVTGEPLGRVLDWWESSERRQRLRDVLREKDNIDPDEVIMSPERARSRGPDLDGDVSARQSGAGRLGHQEYRHRSERGGRRRRLPQNRAGASVHQRESSSGGHQKSRPRADSDPAMCMVLICRGPMGAGMEEIYQITSALKHLSFGKHVAVLTDARFSGVSTGACIGHVGPEALAGGPIGKVRDGDIIEIVIDRNRLEGSVDLIGEGADAFRSGGRREVLANRPPRPDLAADPNLPDDTRLWAALQRRAAARGAGVCMMWR